jgi:hypothetical protein
MDHIAIAIANLDHRQQELLHCSEPPIHEESPDCPILYQLYLAEKPHNKGYHPIPSHTIISCCY